MDKPNYEALFAALPGLYLVLDPGLRVLAVSEAFLRTTLAERRNVVGQLISDVFPGGEGQEVKVRETVYEVLRTRQPQSLSQHPWSALLTPVLGEDGSVSQIICSVEDAAGIERVEALKEADRRKGEFLAMLAHELRNPLAPIRNALSMMRMKGELDPQLAIARELIERQVMHLVRLVDDLLDVSRITFGKVELRRERVDLRAVAQRALAASKPALDESGHRVTVRMSAGPLCVDGDAARLAQVISNLLNNAARYTPHGGEITLEVEREAQDARVSVEDNGTGIAPEMMLGLSLARTLTELHGGRITAQSRGAGRGSRFSVCLPLRQADAASPEPAARAAENVSRHRFLVVDDNVDAASSQTQLLRMLGHEAEMASSGEDALRVAARIRPQVVLLDLGMPGMDGFAVARELRRMPELAGAKLIAQTGWGQEEDRRKTAAAGFDAHLAKPVEVETLMEAVARL